MSLDAENQAYERLSHASMGCLRMIASYYGLEHEVKHLSGVNISNLFRYHRIPIDRVAARHRQLLDLDASMQDAVMDMERETADLANTMLTEDLRERVQCLERHCARLSVYAVFHCDTCRLSHVCAEFSVVRVWPKSARIERRVPGHAPSRSRWKLDSNYTGGSAPWFPYNALSPAVARLRDFDAALDAATRAWLVKDLADIVTAYVGVKLAVVDKCVDFDFD